MGGAEKIASRTSRGSESSDRNPGMECGNGALPPLTIPDCRANNNAERALDAALVTLLTRLARSKLSFAAIACCVALLAAGCSVAPPPPDNARALHEIDAGDSGAELVVSGRVIRVLPEESGPSGIHERFVMLVHSGSRSLALFVADNISVGSAAPIRSGDDVVVKGELAFNEFGPVLHWTHRDPRLRHAPGFVEVAGHMYE